MLKIIACSCFLMGSFGFGFYKVNEYHSRYMELNYIKYILNNMLLETENHYRTFGESCLVMASKCKEPYKEIFAGLYYLLEKERKKTPQQYWDEKISELTNLIPLKKEEILILQGVIKCADGTVQAMPLEVLRQSIEEWDKAIMEAEKVRKEKSKVTLYLSITVGLLLCITVI